MFSPHSTGYLWSEHSFSIILILYTEPVNQRASFKYFNVEAYYLTYRNYIKHYTVDGNWRVSYL